MDSKRFIRELERLGFELVRVRGSHHQFKHPETGQLITVKHPCKDLAKGTLHKMMKDAGLK